MIAAPKTHRAGLASMLRQSVMWISDRCEMEPEGSALFRLFKCNPLILNDRY